MKRSTHIVVGFCTGFTATFFSTNVLEAIVAGTLGGFLNYIIDAYGHRGAFRSPFTHSVIGVTIMCASLGVAIYAILSLTLNYVPSISILEGLLFSGYSHLLLDSLTRFGIYPLYPFSRKRFSIACISYDDPLINRVLIAASILATILLIIHRIEQALGKAL